MSRAPPQEAAHAAAQRHGEAPVGHAARILIVTLSSLGDVVHSAPVIHDIRQACPRAVIDWVVEPAFAPLLRRVEGIDAVIECAMRRWRRAWWHTTSRAEWLQFHRRLRQQPYDAVIDLQGLTKSAVIARLARGTSHGMANRTEGSSFEAPARWLVHHAIQVPSRIHALDRARALAACALGYECAGPPRVGLRTAGPAAPAPWPTVVLVHGTSRDDKLWPEASWIEFGQRAIGQGWRIALPRHGLAESQRAGRIAAALGPAADIWPEMALDALIDQMGATQGVVGVDTGLSHIAVALGLPHVQIYNGATAWRTGPLPAHGHRSQVSVQAHQAPEIEAVWSAWDAALQAPADGSDLPFDGKRMIHGGCQTIVDV